MENNNETNEQETERFYWKEEAEKTIKEYEEVIKSLDRKVYRRKKTHTVMNIISYLTLLITFFFLVIAAYWILLPKSPIEIQEPLLIINKNKTVKAGGVLVYKMNINKKIPVPAVITKQFISETAVVTLPSVIGNVGIGQSNFCYPTKVPVFIESGLNKMKWTGVYQANPMKKVTVVAWSEPFYILNEQPGKEGN